MTLPLCDVASSAESIARSRSRVDISTRPGVVTDIPQDAPLMAEEPFCPATPVVPYERTTTA
jgi:acyl-CoA reductase-like NAD-dependent aldehyde dehydrogenase